MNPEMLKSSSPVQRAEAAHALLRVRSMEIDLNELPEGPAAKRPRLGHKRPRLQTPLEAGQRLFRILDTGAKDSPTWRRCFRGSRRGRKEAIVSRDDLRSGSPLVKTVSKDVPGVMSERNFSASDRPMMTTDALAIAARVGSVEGNKRSAEQLSAMLRSFRSQRRGSQTPDAVPKRKLIGVQSRLLDMARRYGSQDGRDTFGRGSLSHDFPPISGAAEESGAHGAKDAPRREWSMSSDALLFDLQSSPITTDDRTSSQQSTPGEEGVRRNKRSTPSGSRRLSMTDILGNPWPVDSNQETNFSGPVPSFSLTFGSHSYEDPWNRWDLESDPLSIPQRSLGLSKDLTQPPKPVEALGVSFDTVAAQIADTEASRLSDSKFIPPKISQLKGSSASKLETVGTFELDDMQKADIGDIGASELHFLQTS